jgi:hypothetical protein
MINSLRYAQPTGHPTPSLLLRIPSQAQCGSHSSNDVPSNSPQTIAPVCQVEIDAADSTAQDMLQDSDSEEDEDEDEGGESWDLDDDGVSRPHLVNWMIRNMYFTRQLHPFPNNYPCRRRKTLRG